MVPAYDLPGAIDFREALARGRAATAASRTWRWPATDLAFLQYTGGTTGVSKGAMLTHRNIVANMEQACGLDGAVADRGRGVIVTPLPLYHIFSLTVNCLLFMKFGGARTCWSPTRATSPASSSCCATQHFTVMTAVSTLLNALMNQPGLSRHRFFGGEADGGGGDGAAAAGGRTLARS